MRFLRPLLISLCTVFLAFFPASLVPAQTTNATLNGLVLDSSGAVVPGATVQAINDGTNIVYPTTTNNEGVYSIPNLPPGRYHIQVSKPGFKTLIKPDIILNVQDARAVNFTLQVGAASETVTVEGGVPLVNTESAAVSTVVDRQFAENIPLNGRSFQSLITLTPGVITVPSGQTNTAGQFSVNGQRASANSFTVDGVSANFAASPGAFGQQQSSGNLPALTTFGTTQSLVSVDALQEFRVQTSTYSAEYGRQPGGQISIVTRSGTNELHGSLFDYLRNDLFDANDWFADRARQPKPPERQNDFGGTFGGPIVIPGLYNGHNRSFFFFSYEGLRLRLPQFNLANVPTLALRQQAPAGIQPILNAFPLPNGKDLGNGLAEFTAPYSDPSSLDAASIRIDHTINTKLTMFARYNRAPSESLTNLANSGNFSLLRSNRLKTQTITVGATASLTPRASNELKANYSNNGAFTRISMNNFGGATPSPRSTLIPSQYDSGDAETLILFLFPGRTSLPLLSVTGNLVTSERQINIGDNLSYSVASHQFKLGIDYRRVSGINTIASYSLNASFSTQQEVLAATASSGRVSANITTKPVFLNLSAYLQDTWRVSRRLTLNLGARWDLNPAPSEANGNNLLAVNEINNLGAMQLAPPGTPAWKTTYNNLAPRLGVAFQLSQAPGHESVVRGGFGLFYDAGNDLGATNFNQRFPFTSSRNLSNIGYPLSPAQVAPPALPIQAGLTAPYGFFVAFDPDLRLPYTLHWNLAVEQAVGKNQALTLSYVGAAGRRLLQSTQLSLSNINPTFTTIALVKNSAASDYDALQAQFQRRLSRRLQALLSYTWSHTLDDDSNGNTGRVAQRGNAAFDVRHVFAATATYDVPAPGQSPLARWILNHWSIDTSVHAQSGLPVDLVARTQVNPADGSLLDVRPNVIDGIPLYLYGSQYPGGRTINNTVPTAAQIAAAGCAPAGAAKGPFCTPPAGQSGNFGRNQVRGLGAWQIDFALRREFPLTEKLKLQWRLEGFNIFNHPNFGTIQTSLSAANFGQATNMLNRQLGGLNQLYQIGGPRSFQFALKIVF